MEPDNAQFAEVSPDDIAKATAAQKNVQITEESPLKPEQYLNVTPEQHSILHDQGYHDMHDYGVQYQSADCPKCTEGHEEGHPEEEKGRSLECPACRKDLRERAISQENLAGDISAEAARERSKVDPATVEKAVSSGIMAKLKAQQKTAAPAVQVTGTSIPDILSRRRAVADAAPAVSTTSSAVKGSRAREKAESVAISHKILTGQVKAFADRSKGWAEYPAADAAGNHKELQAHSLKWINDSITDIGHSNVFNTYKDSPEHQKVLHHLAETSGARGPLKEALAAHFTANNDQEGLDRLTKTHPVPFAQQASHDLATTPPIEDPKQPNKGVAEAKFDSQRKLEDEMAMWDDYLSNPKAPGTEDRPSTIEELGTPNVIGYADPELVPEHLKGWLDPKAPGSNVPANRQHWTKEDRLGWAQVRRQQGPPGQAPAPTPKPVSRPARLPEDMEAIMVGGKLMVRKKSAPETEESQ